MEGFSCEIRKKECLTRGGARHAMSRNKGFLKRGDGVGQGESCKTRLGQAGHRE